MSVLIFILVLIALIVVHELGHFFAAKWSGMRVEEFGLGYPPKAVTFARHNGTAYTLNWLPFGGFVKIYGEDGVAGAAAPADSFAGKPRYLQALVLLAGIAMNILFAWVLLSVTLAVGMPRALDDDEIALAPDAVLVISRVVAGTPAADAGVREGDTVINASYEDVTFTGADATAFTTFIGGSNGAPITLTVRRAGETVSIVAEPEQNIVADDAQRYALGVGVGAAGTVPVPLLEAPIEGAKLTYAVTEQVAMGLIHFFGSVFTFSADLNSVSGPVGIAGAVGDASSTGVSALLTLVAVISINLALINLVPIPALDGGRLLFVLIEAVIRRPLPASVSGALNAVGFAFLILLMVVVTASDVWKLVS